MDKTLVTPSWLTVAADKDPLTPKILTPLLMLPLVKFASPLMVCVPVRYVPLAMVWLLVPGVMVAAALVVTDAVSDTELLPAVPEDTYPALTVGVTEIVLLRVSVLVPVLTDAEVPLIVAGAVADPALTALLVELA